MKQRIAGVRLLLVLLLVAAPLPAEAGSRALWPDQCRPVSLISNEVALLSARQLFTSLGSAPANQAMYQCELRLPAGRRVTSLAVNASTGGGGYVDALLQRTRLAGDADTLVHAMIGDSFARDWHVETNIVREYAKVRPGYRYFVTLTIFNGSVYGMRVSYR